MNNPSFNNARGSASTLQFKPPFAFKDMTVSVLPLRANISRLQAFCDQYLNQDSDTIRFETYLPYVYLQIIDYGKMSIEAANMGWVSQSEVAFCVPLRWMYKKGNQWRFYDWAVNCPFIYVDNELSMSTGREVYGWPKVLAHIDPRINAWSKDPNAPQQVFDIRIRDPDALSSDDSQHYTPFLSVFKTSPPGFLNMPPNLDGLMEPVTSLPNLGLRMARMTLDTWRTFTDIGLDRLSGESNSGALLDSRRLEDLIHAAGKINWMDPNSWSQPARDILWNLYPQMCMNTINLKQFMDAGKPELACYQAITHSKMEFSSVNGFGPLGQQNLAYGQRDGGYSVHIHRTNHQPVIDALGLEYDSTRDQDSTVAVLKPVFPFYLEVDMNYTRGKTLAWRSRSRHWQSGDSVDNKDANPSVENTSGEPGEDSTGTPKFHEEIRYNTSHAGAIQPFGGRFAMPDTTVRVLPLIADEQKLRQFVANYLNVEGEARFEAWGTQVYMIAYNCEHRHATTAVANYAGNREVSFAVPVKHYRWYDEGDYDLATDQGRAQRDREKLVSTAIVCPFAYANDARAAISSSEVLGIPTMRSDITSPPHTWMNPAGPDAGQKLLTTSALVLPKIGVGAGAKHECLLTVSTDQIISSEDTTGWRRLLHHWGPVIVNNLKQKYHERGWRDGENRENKAFRYLRALGLEVLTGKLSINTLTLKQFRDAWEPEQACYQAIVQGTKTLKRLYEVNEINESLHVHITRYPTQPISEILGLIPKYTDTKTNTEVFEAIRPFWLRADIEEKPGQTLYERTAAHTWKTIDQPDQPLGWKKVSGDELRRSAAQPGTEISWLQKFPDGWRRQMLQTSSAGETAPQLTTSGLLRGVQTGEVREVQLNASHLTRPLMAHSPTLTHIDRNAIADLTAFLANRPEEEISHETCSTLRQSIGKVAPATVIDSMLSRQWGRPAAQRLRQPHADFVAHTNTFGSVFNDQIFHPAEQRQGYWPPSDDERNAEAKQRLGLAWHLWDDVWSQIDQADQTGGYHAITEDDPDSFRKKAEALLPDFFDQVNGSKPSRWSATQWSELAEALESLVEWSRDRVSSPSIVQYLVDWQNEALIIQRQLQITDQAVAVDRAPGFGNGAEQPNIADVLAERINSIAQT